ncbi:Tyrosine recombinase XerC [Photorhabdus australis subsp. thailandensis]|uniref:Tyrosine recombinase XerC n=1 Tax=Photorhabdus australis subsp. thailandensis TaxID=2805096 RepID=A0A1C0U2N1_9GAMM|nr:site-specific integrase [Photorhabdus australis]OCQ52192.1 Tyrosine recombinase XerC [Photorhabdus australis subsp. thailandensis]
MKPTDFAKNLTAFFTGYLPSVKNLSTHTLLSYRDTFRLLLVFCKDVLNIPPEKLCLNRLDDRLITGFLEWLENERNCSVATRNQRLVAIHVFFRYVQVQEPGQLHLCQRILQIPGKKHQRQIVRHLTPEQTKDLLAVPDPRTQSGRRDMTLLSVLYDTGARVQELCDLRVRDIRLEPPAIITLTGKRHKTRHVPLLGNTVALLRSYMQENNLLHNGKLDSPLFINQRHTKLTRGGISHILQKHAKAISSRHPGMKEKITPHILRHSKAMHLYQSGVSLVYIRDILGYVDISTTDIYARADTESKCKALENAYPDITPEVLPDWSHDENLLGFLNNL